MDRFKGTLMVPFKEPLWIPLRVPPDGHQRAPAAQGRTTGGSSGLASSSSFKGYYRVL